MDRRTDTRIEKLHRQIFNRNMAEMPSSNTAYIPDPVKWARLDKVKKLQHIANANTFIDSMVMYASGYRNPRYESDSVRALAELYSSRANFYRSISVPPGFDSVQDYLGAISRDKLGSNFENLQPGSNFEYNL